MLLLVGRCVCFCCNEGDGGGVCVGCVSACVCVSVCMTINGTSLIMCGKMSGKPPIA